jgi:uncharacterized protein YkwD
MSGIVSLLSSTTIIISCAALAVGCSSSPGTASTSGATTASEQDAGGGDAASIGAAQQPFDEFQVHNLDVVNKYRATLSAPPLVLDHALSTFALAGSVELSMDHTPHEHFINALNDNTIQAAGFGDQLAENQGDPNGWNLIALDARTNELDQIDAVQQTMFNEGPGSGEAHGHYTNMMDTQYNRLGVGLLEIGGRLYLTNDFSD